MDKNTLWFRRMAENIFTGPLPPIPYVGRGESGDSGRFYNPPAEHIEISLVTKGQIRNVDIGKLRVDLLSGHLYMHNVHFGNYSPVYKDVESWCVVIDVSGRPAFECMKRKPFFIGVEVSRPAVLVEGFRNLMLCCNPPGMISHAYFGGPTLFDPARKIDKKLERNLKVGAVLFDFFSLVLEEISPGTSRVCLPEKLVQASEFIVLNFQHSGLCLEDIAAYAKISTNYMGVLFRKYMGMTPMQYLRSIRLATAKNLLQRTGLTVGEIALRCGFTDQLYFSREYSRQFGYPPSQTSGRP